MEPKDRAEHSWEKDGVRYYICHVDILDGHYCGYCEFPERLIQEEGLHGALACVPVHGGITYAESSGDAMVYGFCALLEDAENPMIKDIEWLKRECEQMAAGIIAVAHNEQTFLSAKAEHES